MIYLDLLKKRTTLAAILISSYACAADTDAIRGIIGGFTGSNTIIADTVSSSTATPIIGTSGDGNISSVAINASNQGLIGGYSGSGAYAATVSSGVATLITGLPGGSSRIASVDINNSNQGLIGGTTGSSDNIYAATISSNAASLITGLPTGAGQINSVAISDSNQGLIGGYSGSGTAYAATVSSGAATLITGLPGGSSTVNSVAINTSNQGIIGGLAGSNGYAALISSGVAIPITGVQGGTTVNSVDINDSNQAIIGGNTGYDPYAAIISSGAAIPITNLASGGVINSVAINAFNQGVIGGETGSGQMYAAIVSSGIAVPITGLPTTGGGSTISGVAINEFGQGMIGGTVGPNAYAAIFSNGVATTLTGLTGAGFINAVAVVKDNLVPSDSLNGNNLIFANYINKNASQDTIYFIPAYFDGTLAKALESAAPTRNAVSVYTASNNLFYLTTNLSNHLRNQRSIRSRRMAQINHAETDTNTQESEEPSIEVLESEDQNALATPLSDTSVDAEIEDLSSENQSQLAAPASDPSVSSNEWRSKGRLLANMSLQQEATDDCVNLDEKKNPYSIWFEAVGALAFQKEQSQTPGFNPNTGGGILAFDGMTSQNSKVGCGASYLYTHIHEDNGAGHSHINQENLFIYASWENNRFYTDGSLFGGLFQIDQVRNIQMTGFNFTSSSSPNGWQLLPHVELGYNYCTMPRNVEVIFNPFVMLDWANSWQNSYREKGSGPFNAGQKSHYGSLLRAEISLRVYETIYFDTWNLILQEKAGYVNTQSFGLGKVNAFLVGSPGGFTVETLASNQNLGVLEFEMIFAPHNPSYQSALFYQGEFGTQFQSHQLSAEFTWNY